MYLCIYLFTIHFSITTTYSVKLVFPKTIIILIINYHHYYFIIIWNFDFKDPFNFLLIIISLVDMTNRYLLLFYRY